MKPISSVLSATPVTAALAVEERARALRESGRDILSFTIGEPDFDTPSYITEAGRDALAHGKTHYTHAAGSPELREAAADWFRTCFGIACTSREIAVTSGAKYAVYAAVRALTDPGDEVIVPAPAWTSYAEILRLSHCKPVFLATELEDGWRVSPDALEKAITDRTKAVILNDPNNPTGAVASKDELEALSRVMIRHDLYCISDEIYAQLVFGNEPFTSVATIDGMADRTVTVNGVSKSFAMTGWRIGFVCAKDPVISAVRAFLSHTTGSPNTAAQCAAVTALRGPDDETKRMRDAYRARRNLLCSILEDAPGIRFSRPEGAFYLFLTLDDRMKQIYPDGTAFSMALLEKAGVAVVPGSGYGHPNGFRIAYAVSEETVRAGAERIRDFCDRALRASD